MKKLLQFLRWIKKEEGCPKIKKSRWREQGPLLIK